MTRCRPLSLTIRCLVVSALLVACHSLLITAFAQSASATLSGTVEDEHGAVIPGVSITVINNATGAQRQATTNGEGYFVVPLLPPSRYQITAQNQGFTTVRIPEVVLNVGDQKALQIQLKAGDINATVQVVNEAPLINESPAVGTVVDRHQVENMPLNGRSFQSLITLTPGIVQAPASLTQPGQFSANGQRTYSNYFTVDGVSANTGITSGAGGSAFGGAQAALTQQGTTQSLVSIDALQEFRIQTSNYAAEFGRSPGAQVQLLTRSGENQFHGTLFDYLRNDKLDANDWFANSKGTARLPERQNDFGGTFSGPVLLPRFGEGGHQPGYNGHNRTFFFLNYEGLRLRQPQFALTNVPTLCLRGLGGCVTGQSPAATSIQPFINAYPLPTGANLLTTAGQPTGLARYADSHSDPSTLNATSIRIDHTFSGRLSLFGRYSNTPSSTATRTLSTVTKNTTNFETVTAGATMTLTSNLINEVRVNFSRSEAAFVRTLDNFSGAVPPPDSLLVPSFESGRPAIFTFGISLTGGLPALNKGPAAGNLQRQMNFVDSLSLTHGSHAIKFGGDYRRLFPVFGPREYAESLIILGLSDAQNGKISTATISSQLSNVKPVFTNLSLYGQDTWRLNRRLTLDYGLRWELNPTPHNSNGPDPSVLTGLDNPATFALAPAGTPLYPTRYNNFAPRFGAAFQLRQKHGWETVLRGGVGVFYDLGSSEAAEGFGGFPNTISKSILGATYPFTDAQLAPATASLTPPYNGNFFVYDAANYNLP